MARPVVEIDDTKLAEMAAGRPLWAIAKELGVSVGTIRSRLKALGIKKEAAVPETVTPGRGQAPIDEAELRRLVRGRYSVTAMAKYFGVARETIVSRKKKLGI